MIFKKRNKKVNETKLLSNALALGLPFTKVSFHDENGIYIGNTLDENPIFVDFFKKDSQRNSHSSVIFGMNGKGKTMLVSKLIKEKAMNLNNKVIIIDPKRDYERLVKNLNGEYIDMSGSYNGCPSLNPFEVFVKKHEDKTNALVYHYRFLTDFFKILFPELNHIQISYLDLAMRKTYKSKKIDENTNLEKLSAKNYPIFDDLLKFIKKDKSKEISIPLKEEIIALLKNFCSGGNYQYMWNKHTNINIDNNHLICFDIQKLISGGSQDSNIANTQLFLMLQWMYSIIVKNKDYNDRNPSNLKWIDLFIDEGHVLTTHKNKTPLHFLFTMFKIIRGFSGGVHFITQNIVGLLGNSETKEFTTGMLDNAQYMFIFGLAPNDISNLNTLFDTIGGLTDNEKEFLATANIGECIFAPFSKLRFITKINISDIEFDLFKKDLRNIDLSIYYPQTEEQEVINDKG